MRPVSRLAALLATCLPFCWTLPAAGSVLSGHCDLNKASWKIISAEPATTTSTSFVPVPHGKISFHQSKKGCVVVQFSSGATAQFTALGVQARLDNETQSQPTELFFESVDITAQSLTLVFPDVGAGNHFVQLYYRKTATTSGPVELINYTAVVQYQ